MTPIISIDPGASGGIAYMNEEGIVTAFPMPQTEGDVVDHLRMLIASGRGAVAVIEQVGGYVGGAGNTGSTMFTFGRGVGFIMGCLMMANIPITDHPTPPVWQKHFGLGRKGELEKKEWKNKLKAEAQRRFPHLKVTLKTADALLILAWKMDKLDRT
jgi:hypothetical protein